jgi:hypothetical protein
MMGHSGIASVLALLLCAPLSLAQCSMCRTAAAAQGAQSAVLDAAIIVLFLPAVTLFGGIILLAIKSAAAAPGDVPTALESGKLLLITSNGPQSPTSSPPVAQRSAGRMP